MVYVVCVDSADEYIDVPHDGLYGYDPIIFAAQSRAESRAELLSESGDWALGQPTYHVVCATLRDVRDGLAIRHGQVALRYGVDILPE